MSPSDIVTMRTPANDRRVAFGTHVVVTATESQLFFDLYSIDCSWRIPASPVAANARAHAHGAADRDLFSEQEIIDRLIEAVEEGDTRAKELFAERLLEGGVSRDWKRRTVAESGVICRFDDFDPGNADLEDLAQALEAEGTSEERLGQIAAGEPLTSSEMTEWRAWVRARLDPHDDPEYQNEWVLLRVRHSRFRSPAYVAVTNWKSNSGRFVAAYSTYTEALSALRQIGTIAVTSHLVSEEQ